MRSIFAVLLVLSLFPAAAWSDDSDTAKCDKQAKVYLDKMGMVDEHVLQKHIDETKAQMGDILHGRGSHFDRRKDLLRHLETMQKAMEELHNAMYASGCKEEAHGASPEVRLRVLETRLNMLEQLMEQLIAHLNAHEAAEAQSSPGK